MKMKVALVKYLLKILVIAGLLAPAYTAHAAVDMFLQLESIDGESKDSVHANEIDVLAWSEGTTNSSSIAGGAGTGTGKPNFQPLSITKYIDSSSPELRLRVADGTHIPTAKLTVRKAGAQPLEYFIIEMTNVIVSSVSAGGAGGEDRLTENVTFLYSTIKWTYVPQQADGSGGAAIDTSWDVLTNTKI